MRRVLLFATLILLSCFTAQRLPNTKEQNARDFVTGFFSTLYGNFTLDENCIGKETKENIHNIIDAFHNEQIFKIFDNIKAIVKITEDTCPIDFTESYVTRKYNAIKEGYYFNNFQKNFFKISEVAILAINDKEKSAYSYGVACGTIEKMTIFKQENRQLTFLALNETPEFLDFDIDTKAFKIFFNGILEGVSSVPFEQNVCYNTPIAIEIEEVQAIAEKLYKSIKERNGSDFYDAILQIIKLLGELKNANEHCNISGLIKSIGVYSTPYVGVAKLIYNIATHYELYYDDLQVAYLAFGNKEWKNAGKSTGKFISTLLAWNTS